jgi:hypothetical protein
MNRRLRHQLPAPDLVPGMRSCHCPSRRQPPNAARAIWTPSLAIGLASWKADGTGHTRPCVVQFPRCLIVAGVNARVYPPIRRAEIRPASRTMSLHEILTLSASW